MRRDFEALDIDVLGATDVDDEAEAVHSVELGFMGTAGEVLSEKASGLMIRA